MIVVARAGRAGTPETRTDEVSLSRSVSAARFVAIVSGVIELKSDSFVTTCFPL